MLERFLTVVVTLLATLTLAAGPAAASTGDGSPPPPDPGGTHAFLVYVPSTVTMTATGNTVGWKTGHLTIYGTLRAPNGSVVWERNNECWNSSYCTIPSYSFCPAMRGKWTMYVIAYGPGGSQDHTAEAWV